MVRALTTKTVEAAKPGSSRQEIPDPALSGLYLIVQPSGAKSWALRYRFAAKPKKLTLGRWPAMGVAAARIAASDAIEAVEMGNDPSASKKASKAAILASQMEERDKIKTLFDQYANRHLITLKSGETVKRELHRHVIAGWSERKVQDITRRDVIDLLDGIADSGRVVTANRVRSYLSKFMNWCVERDVIGVSPAMGVKAVGKEKSRDRVLSDDEVRLFWLATESLGQPWGYLGQLLLLTGQRLGEVAAMTEGEIEGSVWHLAPSRTKNGRAHVVPLSEAAQSVIERLEVIRSDEGYLFTTNGRSPVQGYHKGRNHIADLMQQMAEQDIPHWTFHDLRRTAATGMARLGIPVRVTEAVLNHVSGTGGGIVEVYQRHDYLDEKRSALEAWAGLVARIVEDKADNVVRIGGQG